MTKYRVKEEYNVRREEFRDAYIFLSDRNNKCVNEGTYKWDILKKIAKENYLNIEVEIEKVCHEFTGVNMLDPEITRSYHRGREYVKKIMESY